MGPDWESTLLGFSVEQIPKLRPFPIYQRTPSRIQQNLHLLEFLQKLLCRNRTPEDTHAIGVHFGTDS